MSIYSFTFSPTGTSAQIAHSITAGISEALNIDIHHADLTFNPAGNLKFSHEDIVIISSPVYGGKIAPLTKQRLSTIQGNGAKCIVVAVYGNRAFENALTDLSEFMSDHGFQVCSSRRLHWRTFLLYSIHSDCSRPTGPERHGRCQHLWQRNCSQDMFRTPEYNRCLGSYR